VVLSTVEGRHEWYRYHGLIRSVLRHQLRGESAERERELLRRAAAWHIERNDVSAAIGYLVEAGEDRAAVDLLSMYGWTEVGARPRTVLDWVERLPLEVRRRDVAVMLLELAARLGLHDSASTTGVVRSLMRAPVTDGEEVARDALGSMWLLHQGQVHDAVRRADRALDRVERLDDDGSLLDAPGARQLIVENAEAAKAEALVFLGDLGGAEKVVSTRFEHGAVVDDVALLGLEAIVAAFAGRLGRATWLAERGLTLADAGSGGRREHAAMCLFAQAVVAREQQRLDQAHELLDLVEDRGTGSPLLAELVSVERIDLSLREDRRPGPAGTIIELRSA
jgi:ATP/maltotriose-dependent transcriptional regulator MalT